MPSSQLFVGYAMGVVFVADILAIIFPQLFIFKWILQFYVLYVVWEGSDVIFALSEDTHLAVFNFGVRLQILDSRNNFCNTGFIIGTEQSVTVGNNKRMPHILLHFGKILCRKHYILFFIKNNITTSILNHTR